MKRKGHEAVQLGVAFELDMERYVSEGRWCYLPRLAVSTVERAEFQFMKSDAFVEYAAYYYAELMEGVTSCEEHSTGHIISKSGLIQMRSGLPRPIIGSIRRTRSGERRGMSMMTCEGWGSPRIV